MVSRLDEKPLRILAEKTGGTYRRLDSMQDFAAIYRDEIRASNPEQESVSREKIWTERHMLASLLAFFCFALDAWLFQGEASVGRKRSLVPTRAAQAYSTISGKK